jgi:hypothetical protein
MTMRLGFAIAAFLDADILLLDEVFAVGDEAFQRKCFGRIADFKQRGGTIVFVSHDAAAVERLCARALLLHDGLVVFDGTVHEALARYRRQLAELDGGGGGDGKGGTGGTEASIAGARVLDGTGAPRRQFLAGEPLAIEVVLRAAGAAPSPRLRVAVRDDAGLLVAQDEVDAGPLGWPHGGGELPLRLDVPSPPLRFGRFHLALELVDDGGRLLHSLPDALTFVVYPDGDERGLVRLGGTWSAGANEERR